MQDFIKGSNGYIYVKVQELMGEIETYKFGNTALDEEIKILFPEITSVSLGTVSNYSNQILCAYKNYYSILLINP